MKYLLIVLMIGLVSCTEPPKEEMKVAIESIDIDGDVNNDGTQDWGDGSNIDGDFDEDGTKDWGNGENIDGDWDEDGTTDWGDGSNLPSSEPPIENNRSYLQYFSVEYSIFNNEDETSGDTSIGKNDGEKDIIPYDQYLADHISHDWGLIRIDNTSIGNSPTKFRFELNSLIEGKLVSTDILLNNGSYQLKFKGITESGLDKGEYIGTVYIEDYQNNSVAEYMIKA